MSIQAYQRAATQGETPRDTEYRAFAHVTAKLTAAREAGRAQIGELAQALADNRMLWTLLAQDCAQPANALPPALRAQIISLANFVHKHTSAVLRDGEDLDVLIDINRDMLEGLAGR